MCIRDRDEVIQMANIFRANIIDVSRETLTVAIFGDRDKTEALVRLLRDFGVLEIARTGTIAIERGRSTIYDDNKIKDCLLYTSLLIITSIPAAPRTVRRPSRRCSGRPRPPASPTCVPLTTATCWIWTGDGSQGWTGPPS